MMIFLAQAGRTLFFKLFDNLFVQVFRLPHCGRSNSSRTDLIPMIPHVPRHFPDFLDQRLKPGLTRIAPLEPFLVSVLNISPPNARAAH
jgi:hypothetical protein